MIVKIMDEAQVWSVIDNMQYFDIWTLEETKPWPGLISSMVGSYGDEGGVIKNMRFIRDLLAKHDGSVWDATVDVESYSVLEMMEDLLLKRLPRITYLDIRTFEFWLKIYQRRGVCRGLTMWKQYNTPLPDLLYYFDKWWRDPGPNGARVVFAKYNAEIIL